MIESILKASDVDGTIRIIVGGNIRESRSSVIHLKMLPLKPCEFLILMN